MQDLSDLMLFKSKLNNKLNQLVETKFSSKNLQQRGVADLLERLCSEKISELNSESIKIFEASSKRSIEDLSVAFKNYLICLDIKSHDQNGQFCMPNLISIDRAKAFLRNPLNHIWYIFIDYETLNEETYISKIEVRAIEELSWGSLAIQNLGKGQLQIKDNNKVMDFNEMPRDKWLEKLREEKIKFLSKQILVLQKRKEEELKEI